MGVQTFPNKSGEKSFDVFKFIVNNGDGITVQCNVYEKQISIFENKIVPDEVSKLFYFYFILFLLIDMFLLLEDIVGKCRGL